MNSSLSQKQYKLLLFFLTLFIFIFWFIQGYHTLFWIDVMAEMEGITMLFKFPETLWNDVKAQTSTTGPYHVARWTANFMVYTSMQTVGKLYAFITKDPVTSIYMAQGFYFAIYYTALAWVVLLYIKIAFKISLKSLKALLVLFCTGALPIVFSVPYTIGKFSLATPSNPIEWFNFNLPTSSFISPSFNTHYMFTTVLMLFTLLPYWQLFFNDQWNKKLTTPFYQVMWYLFILLTAFSSTGTSMMFFVAQAMIGITFFFFLPQKNIIERIWYCLSSPPPYVKSLYFGGILSITAVISESIFGIQVGSLNIINSIKSSFDQISTILIFNIPFFIYYLYLGLSKMFSNKDKESNTQITKLFCATLFIQIFVCTFFVLISSVRGFYLYRMPILIVIFLNGFLLVFHLLHKKYRPMVYAFMIMFIFSRYLFFIPIYPNTVDHLNEHSYYQELHARNNSRTNNHIVLTTFSFHGAFEYARQSHILSIERFLKVTGIIDHNVELTLHEDLLLK